MHGLAIAIHTVSAIFTTAMREAVQDNINFPLTQLSLVDGSHCQSMILHDLTAKDMSDPGYLSLSPLYIYTCTLELVNGLDRPEWQNTWT